MDTLKRLKNSALRRVARDRGFRKGATRPFKVGATADTLVWQNTEYGATPPVAERLAAGKQIALGWMRVKRKNAEVGGMVYDGHNVRTDRNSQWLIAWSVTQASVDATLTVDWDFGGGDVVAMDAAAVIAFGKAVYAYVQGQRTKESTKINAIMAATTLDDVAAVTWEDA